MSKIKKLVYSLAVMVFAVVAFSSCDKNEELMNFNSEESSLNYESPAVRSAGDGIDYEGLPGFGSTFPTNSYLNGPSRAIIIPAKTCYCVKLTDSYRNMLRWYKVRIWFDTSYPVPNNSAILFDRSRNYWKWDDDDYMAGPYYVTANSNHSVETAKETNSDGPQGSGSPGWQWIRFKNATNNDIHVCIQFLWENK